MDVLSEDFGSALIRSNKIFNIFLKKYLFKSPPSNEEECRNILENAYKIKKEIIKAEKNDKEELNILNIEIKENKEEEENNNKEIEPEEPKKEEVKEEQKKKKKKK